MHSDSRKCSHKHISREVIFGQKSGDWICDGCGELFTSKKEWEEDQAKRAEGGNDE